MQNADLIFEISVSYISKLIVYNIHQNLECVYTLGTEDFDIDAGL